MTTGAYLSGFLLLALWPDWRGAPTPFVALDLLLYAAFIGVLIAWIRVRGMPWTRLIVTAGILARLLVFALHPEDLSHDVARYAWDGHLMWQGINPFAHAPGDPALSAYRTDYFDAISYKEIPTIYPPVAQGLFAAAGLLGGGPAAVRFLLVLCDIGLLLVLARLLANTGRPAGCLLVYAWCPLPVIEIASSGHIEPLGVLLVLLSALAIGVGRPVGAGAAWAGAVLAKVGPVLLAPLLVRRGGWRAVVAAVAVFVGLTLPFLGAGAQMFRALGEYSSRWRYNDFAFAGLVRVCEFVGVDRLLAVVADRLDATFAGDIGKFAHAFASPHGAARLAAAGVLLATIVGLVWWRREPGAAGYLHEVAVVIALGVLLTPTLHPWYLLWLLPLLCFFPSPPWILLCGTVVLSYLDLATGRDAVLGPSMVVWLEYLAPLSLWVFLAVRQRRLRLLPVAGP